MLEYTAVSSLAHLTINNHVQPMVVCTNVISLHKNCDDRMIQGRHANATHSSLDMKLECWMDAQVVDRIYKQGSVSKVCVQGGDNR